MKKVKRKAKCKHKFYAIKVANPMVYKCSKCGEVHESKFETPPALEEKRLTTADKILEACEKRVQKKYVAELLSITRPTLYRKLKDNDFSEDEVHIMYNKNIIGIDNNEDECKHERTTYSETIEENYCIDCCEILTT